jgi:hydrogenase nickel incorporation protein HypA/HybF
MHELSISRAILDTAIGHACGRRVVLVSVTIGALRQVVPESLEFYFQLLSRDTVCEGAPLDWRLEPARLRCACGEEWELAAPSFRCPRCGRGQVTVLAGDQLAVDSIEVEEEESCTAPR